MSSPTSVTVIRGLYKQLVRYCQNLEFTDKEFFLRELRKRFNKPRATPEDIHFAVRKGQKFLETRRLL